MPAMHEQASFAPPGPGVWELESTHIIRPISRFFEALYPAAATEGFKIGMARYGMLLDYIDYGVVNRFIYICPRPVGAPKNAKGHPPKLVFKLLTKLHPEIRKRIKTLQEVFATKRWREDVARWDAEWKPAIIKENTELQRVDVTRLTDEQLIAHLQRLFDVVRRGIVRHHSLNATAMLPLGDFLAHVKEWTGAAPSEVLPLFRGASRVSKGAADELEALGKALAQHSDAATLLAGDDPQAVVDALTARQDAVGEAARRYVEAASARLATGYDLSDLTVGEMPELLVESMRAALTNAQQADDGDVARREIALRERVPAEHRKMFDELLAEARFTYRIRDERGYDNDSWSGGIARLAVLEAGRRLVAKGRLQDAEHAVELTPSEMTSMLAGGPGRTAQQAADDVTFRTTHTFRDMPPHLGGTPSGPPPIDWFPPVAARAARAIGIVMGEMFAAREREKASTKVTGFAASPGQVVGIARLVLDPREMARVKKGDVLVTRSTSPAYNALLPLIGGVVTDRGGTLSHAAVVAREYGIPAVVGTGNATDVIRDGMRIRVDGGTGSVEVLA